MAKLVDLPFIDMYLRLDEPGEAEYKSSEPGQTKYNRPIPPEYQEDVIAFAEAIKVHLGNQVDGKIEWGGLIARLSQRKMTDDTQWVCARRIGIKLPELEKLGLEQHILAVLKTLGKREGLILISGATGSGKTTTAVAILTYFLNQYGGTAITLEDPCEFPLHGRHGETGRCFQTEITEEGEWAVGLKKSLRWGPRYIYVGEVRTPGAAEQLLRAASTGHLVIATVHASDMIEALSNLAAIADKSMGGGAKDALASSILAVTSQSIIDGKINLKFVSTDDNPADPVRVIIRDGKLAGLTTQIEQKDARLRNAAGMPPLPSTNPMGMGSSPPASMIGSGSALGMRNNQPPPNPTGNRTAPPPNKMMGNAQR